MKVHITNLYGMAYKSVAQMAQQMVAKIAEDNFHFNELGVYNYYDPNESDAALASRFDGILASVGDDDVIILQSPNWNSIEWETAFIERTGIYRNVKRIMFIHDVIPLMFKTNFYLLDNFINFYNQMDVVIVPTQKMLDYLREHGLTVEKVVIQHMWDHPCHIDPTVNPENNKVITYIGNADKAQFIQKWDHPDMKLNLFIDPAEWGQGKNVEFEGWHDDSELVGILRKTGGFGLLWGDKPDWVQYMKLNCSYKLSTYLAAGIPVICNHETPEAEVIKRKHLGIVEDDLETAIAKAQAMTDDEYCQMRDAVGEFSNLIRDGYFTKRVLAEAVFKALYE